MISSWSLEVRLQKKFLCVFAKCVCSCKFISNVDSQSKMTRPALERNGAKNGRVVL